MRTRTLSVCLTVVVLFAGITMIPFSASSQQGQAQATPEISITDQPADPIAPNSTFTITYELTNTGNVSGAFTLNANTLPANVSVTAFSGDIQGPDPDSSPPSTSTTAIDGGDSATVTITYRAGAKVTGDQSLGVRAIQPIDQTTDEQQTTVTISESRATPNVTVADTPRVVAPGQTFEITYAVRNTGTQNGAFTMNADTLPSNVSVIQFTGDVQAPAPDASPPRVSTVSLPANSTDTTSSVTVTYRANASVTGEQVVGVTAEDPLTGSADNVSSTVIIEDPTDRALQAANTSDPSQISQDDITVAITKRDRGEQINNVAVTQDDITIMITLRDRNIR